MYLCRNNYDLETQKNCRLQIILHSKKHGKHGIYDITIYQIWGRFLQKVSIQPYNPSASNTSKYISCGSSLCHSSSSCLKESDNCPYSIDYLSDNTSSSGILVEDVIHLASATTRSGDSVEFPFVFGYVVSVTMRFSSDLCAFSLFQECIRFASSDLCREWDRSDMYEFAFHVASWGMERTSSNQAHWTFI
jgi:hypothetical protein